MTYVELMRYCLDGCVICVPPHLCLWALFPLNQQIINFSQYLSPKLIYRFTPLGREREGDRGRDGGRCSERDRGRGREGGRGRDGGRWSERDRGRRREGDRGREEDRGREGGRRSEVGRG